MPSIASSLNPHQSDQTVAPVPLAASRSRTVEASTAWGKERDLEAELAAQIHHLRHLVGPVAVVLDQDVAAEHLGQRLILEVTVRRGSPSCLAFHLSQRRRYRLGRDERPPGTPPCCPSAWRGPHGLHTPAWGFSPARHLQAVGRVRKLHLLHRPGGDHFQDGAAPTDQVGGARKGFDGGDAARDGQRDLGVLRPERVLGPYVRGVGARVASFPSLSAQVPGSA